MESLDIRRIVKCYGWLMAIALLVGGASSAYFTYNKSVFYEAPTTVIVGPSDRVGNIETALRSLDSVSRRNVMATYAQIPTSRSVIERAREELALPKEQMRGYHVRTSIIPDTNVLRITVRGPMPRITAEFANAVVHQSQQLVPEFYDGIISFKILDAATEPTKPIDLGAARKVALGALLGLLLSLGLVFIIEHFRFVRAGTSAHATATPKARSYA